MGDGHGTGTGLCFPELLIVGILLAVLGVAGAARYRQADAESDYARILGNFKAVAAALDAYKVDNGQLPETDSGGGFYAKMSILRLTTPVAYLTSLPVSPYDETVDWGPSSSTVVARTNSLFYLRKYFDNPAIIDLNFSSDVTAYYFQGALVPIPVRNEFIAANEWEIISVGPDGIEDRSVSGSRARVYDPTNGMFSRGNVVWFSAYRVPQPQPVYTTWRTY